MTLASLFFSVKERYALTKGKREIGVFLFCFFNVHRLILHLLVNPECRKPILALRRNSLDLLATIRVTTCIYAQLHKNYAFSPFFYSFPSSQYIETNLLEKIKTPCEI